MNILFCFLTLLLYCALYLSLNFSNAVSTENKPWGSWIGVGHLGLVKWLPGTLGVGKAIWSFNFYMFFFQSVSLFTALFTHAAFHGTCFSQVLLNAWVQIGAHMLQILLQALELEHDSLCQVSLFFSISDFPVPQICWRFYPLYCFLFYYLDIF